MRKMNRPTVYDPLILNRVKQYLEDNVHQTYLDVGLMAKALQDRYPEYSRRKFVPFRLLVEQAYTTIRDSLLKDKDNAAASDDSDGSDLEMMEEPTTNCTLNNMLTGLYNRQKSTADKTNNDAAIDISSDESGVETCANGKSKSKVKQFRDVTLTKIGGDLNSTPKLTSLIKEQPENSKASVGKRDEVRTMILENSKNKRRRLESRSPSPKANNRQIDKAGIDSGSSSSSFHQQTSNSQNQQQRVVGGFNQLPHFPTVGGQLRVRRYKKEIHPQKSRQSFQDIGGMDKILKELCELLMHIKQPDIYFVLGLMPPRGILLHGPPGCGKTLLAHAIAGQMAIPLIEIAATELIAGVSGESEERIRDVFEQATALAPCLLFIDEIDAISSNRLNAQKDMERRIVSQLISSLDFLKASENGQSVLVVGATTRPDVLDPALRRVGRFDHEIAIGIPSRKDRREILSIICDGLSVEQKFDYDKIAELTPGYVGADLLALVSRAATIAVKRKCAEQMREFQAKQKQNITIVDLIDENAADDDGEKKIVSGEADIQPQKIDKEKEIESDQNKENTESTTKENIHEEVSEKIVESVETVDKEPENVNGTETAEVEEVEKMELGEEGTKIVNKPEDEKEENVSNETKKISKVFEDKHSEPTLFEMLNWLDKSYDDYTIGDFCIIFADFLEAVKVVQPSAKREGFITVPDVTWDDIGSLQDIREELKLAVLAPVKFPEKLAKLGLSAPSGILLCGPPGCGKTLLAKAIANEAGINFISVKGPEMMNMYVGESERAVRACFQRARNSSPCVIFFDEFDSLCPKRSDNNDSGSGTRIVNQLLTEMDGVEDRKGVYILAATNRPDIIDPAILRPGRLDTILYVGLPQTNDRQEILNAQTKNRTKPVLADDVDFADLAQKTDGYTGADLAGLVRQASMLALKESINCETQLDDLCVNRSHFEEAIKLLRPSVTPQDRKVYDKLREKYAAPRIPGLSPTQDTDMKE